MSKETFKSERKKALDYIEMYEAYLMQQYLELSSSRFEYTGLVELGIKQTFIEQELFNNGKLMFTRDTENTKAPVILNLVDSGVNLYGEGRDFIGISLNGEINVQRNYENCVPMYDNTSRLGIKQKILPNLKDIVNAKIAENYNINNMKIPFIVTGNSSQKGDLINFHKDKMNGVPFLFFIDDNINRTVGSAPLEILPINVTSYLPDLANYVFTKHNTILQLLGINFTPYEKSERLLVGEVNSNNMQVSYILNQAYQFRARFIEKINEMFSLNLSVSIANLEDIQKNAGMITEQITGKERYGEEESDVRN